MTFTPPTDAFTDTNLGLGRVQANIIPASNAAANYDANGVFDHHYFDADAGAMVGVETKEAIFTAPTASLTVAPVEGDTITISGSNYEIRDVEPDGVTFTVLRLKQEL